MREKRRVSKAAGAGGPSTDNHHYNYTDSQGHTHFTYSEYNSIIMAGESSSSYSSFIWLFLYNYYTKSTSLSLLLLPRIIIRQTTPLKHTSIQPPPLI